MSTTEELLARLVNAGKTTTKFSGTGVGSGPTTYPTVILRRQCTNPVNWSHRHAHIGQAEDVQWSASESTTWQFCVCAARKNERRGSDPVINSDMTVELQSLSTQLYYLLVMMLSDQALDIVRNSLEGVGAEVWRKLL